MGCGSSKATAAAAASEGGGITSNSFSATTSFSAPAGISALPGTDELNSSSKDVLGETAELDALEAVLNDIESTYDIVGTKKKPLIPPPSGNEEHVAGELLEAAKAADEVLGTERDRQRRAHQERMIMKQAARENEQNVKLNAYAEGPGKVDSTIDEQRERQQKEFQRRLSQRTKKYEKFLGVDLSNSGRIDAINAMSIQEIDEVGGGWRRWRRV